MFLEDGRVEMDNNVVERAIRPIPMTRKAALFAGSDGGARHWAIAMTLIQTAKLNGVEPMAWLTDVLQRIVSGRTKAHELHTVTPSTRCDQCVNARCDAPKAIHQSRQVTLICQQVEVYSWLLPPVR